MRNCPGCDGVGLKKFTERIDYSLLNEHSYSSRKRPELFHHEYLECCQCRSLFTPDIHNPEDLISAYERSTFISNTESRFAAKTYVRQLERLGLLPDTGVLDVGCADGAFLLELYQRGIQNLMGVEPSLSSIESADPSIQGQILQGTLTEFPITMRPHLVTCFQTIEHVADPESFMSEVHGVLAPGGRFIVVCHDRQSLVNRLLGKKSPVFDIEHMQIFTRRGVEALFRRKGFTDVEVRSIANRYPVAYWALLAPLSNKFKDRVNRYRGNALLRTALTLRVGNILVSGVKQN